MRTEFRRWTRFWQKSKQISRNMRHYQKALRENRTDTEMKFYKVVARPSLLYGSETWLTTKRDMTGLEAAEMRFLRSATGYTWLDKIRSEVVRKELEISGIQNERLKYKQNWINHLERMDNTRLPKRPQLQTSRKKRLWAPQETMTGSMLEEVKRPNPWRKIMMMMMMKLCSKGSNVSASYPVINTNDFTSKHSHIYKSHNITFITIIQ